MPLCHWLVNKKITALEKKCSAAIFLVKNYV